MNFDWLEYLTLAQALFRRPAQMGNEEASLRCAISRAYYAAFCASRNFARDRGEITVMGRPSDHGLVIGYFKESPDRERRRIGTWLDRLRDDRNSADYEDKLPGNIVAMAQSSVAKAANVFEVLRDL